MIRGEGLGGGGTGRRGTGIGWIGATGVVATIRESERAILGAGEGAKE
jgi:hypothetical protein